MVYCHFSHCHLSMYLFIILLFQCLKDIHPVWAQTAFVSYTMPCSHIRILKRNCNWHQNIYLSIYLSICFSVKTPIVWTFLQRNYLLRGSTDSASPCKCSSQSCLHYRLLTIRPLHQRCCQTSSGCFGCVLPWSCDGHCLHSFSGLLGVDNNWPVTSFWTFTDWGILRVMKQTGECLQLRPSFE